MKTKMSPAEQERKNYAKVDPELLKQINTVAADDGPVAAVFMLRPDDPTQIAAPPDRTEELIRELLQRVEKRIGVSAKQINIFRNLGAFAISARPEFLRELLTQPEIASAMANRQQEQAYIPPRDVEPVTPDSDRGWSSSGSQKNPSGRSKHARSSTGRTRKTSKSGKSSGSGKSSK